jgi:hypothetical protein
MTTLSLSVLDPDLVTEMTDQSEVLANEKAQKKADREQKKADRAERAANRLRSTIDGDPEGSRRCTHPEHDGPRLFIDAINGEGGFYIKPNGQFGGSWCGDCKRRVGAQKRAERNPDPQNATLDAAVIEQVPVDTEEISELFAQA